MVFRIWSYDLDYQTHMGKGGGDAHPYRSDLLVRPPKKIPLFTSITTPVTSEMIVARPCVTRGFCQLEYFRLGLKNS